MQIDHLKKCAHVPCVCEITSEQEYCSDRCRNNAADGSDTCTCGHIDCAVEPVEIDADLALPA